MKTCGGESTLASFLMKCWSRFAGTRLTTHVALLDAPQALLEEGWGGLTPARGPLGGARGPLDSAWRRGWYLRRGGQRDDVAGGRGTIYGIVRFASVIPRLSIVKHASKREFLNHICIEYWMLIGCHEKIHEQSQTRNPWSYIHWILIVDWLSWKNPRTKSNAESLIIYALNIDCCFTGRKLKWQMDVGKIFQNENSYLNMHWILNVD